MKKDKVDIEQLFKQNFENAAIKPNTKVWLGLEKSLTKLPKSILLTRWIITVASFGMATLIYFVWPQVTIVEQNPILLADSSVELVQETPSDLNKEGKTENLQSENFNSFTKIDKNIVKQKDEEFNNVTSLKNYKNVIISPEHIPSEEIENKTISTAKAVIAFENSTHEGCAPLLVEFKNYSINLSSFEWKMGDGYLLNRKDIIYTYNNPGIYVVQLKAVNEKGVALLKYDTIIVHDIPKAYGYISTAMPYTTDLEIEYKSTVENNESVKWLFGDGEISSVINTSHKYKQEGIYDVYFKVTNEKNCTDSILVQKISVSSLDYSILFPTAFAPNKLGEPEMNYTPNSRTSNQLFYPIYQGVEKYHLKIFNRRGVLMFETNDLAVGWTGYYKGKLAQQNVYIWKAVGTYSNGKNFTKAGNITLIY